jgi:3-oxoacyl-[acyl-carrier-protein] synthase III
MQTSSIASSSSPRTRAAQGLKQGLLFTADPYSPIIDESDKNTSLLFGDAATVTWIGPDPNLVAGRFTFGTIGAEQGELTCLPGGKLYMNGRAVFNFAAHYVPADIRKLAAINGVELNEIDRFIFHQGSKYIVDTLTRLLQLAPNRVALDLREYGNTVSSSIPLILAREIEQPENRRLALCGFGAGLSWASTLLTRNSNV